MTVMAVTARKPYLSRVCFVQITHSACSTMPLALVRLNNGQKAFSMNGKFELNKEGPQIWVKQKSRFFRWKFEILGIFEIGPTTSHSASHTSPDLEHRGSKVITVGY